MSNCVDIKWYRAENRAYTNTPPIWGTLKPYGAEKALLHMHSTEYYNEQA